MSMNSKYKKNILKKRGDEKNNNMWMKNSVSSDEIDITEKDDES